jgi:hypothetical protein
MMSSKRHPGRVRSHRPTAGYAGDYKSSTRQICAVLQPANAVYGPGCISPENFQMKSFQRHSRNGATRSTGFSTIGRFTTADSTPNRIESHHTTS